MRGIPYGESLLVASLVRSLGAGTQGGYSMLVYGKRLDKNGLFSFKMQLSLYGTEGG